LSTLTIALKSKPVETGGLGTIPIEPPLVVHDTRNSISLGGVAMRRTHSSILERINKALHAQYDDIAKQPLPDRWVDLINYLNEKERMQRDAPQTETEPHPNRRRPH
jgi:hypothetical protein